MTNSLMMGGVTVETGVLMLFSAAGLLAAVPAAKPLAVQSLSEFPSTPSGIREAAVTLRRDVE